MSHVSEGRKPITLVGQLRNCPVGTIIELEPYEGVHYGITIPHDAEVVMLVERNEGQDLWYFVGSDIPMEPHELHLPAKVIRWGAG